MDLLQELDETLVHDVTMRHSYFQLKYFVIGKEPTTQAKMWQCLRELKSRRDSLKSIDLEIEQAKDEAEELDIAAERLRLPQNHGLIEQYQLQQKTEAEQALDYRERQIKLRKIERRKVAHEESTKALHEKRKWIEQEARLFLDAFRNLQNKEPLKSFDDLESQKEYWQAKLEEKLNLKLLFQQPVDVELISTILALPPDVPIKRDMMQRIESIQKNLLEVQKAKRLGGACDSQTKTPSCSENGISE